MYNLYVREDDGSAILAYANLTLDEALAEVENILCERTFTEVIISEVRHG